MNGRTNVISSSWRWVTSLGELTLLFWAALRGAMRRPFYWREFLEQCRFILTANFVPLLLTGAGFGAVVALEAGHFFPAASAEDRLGGLTGVGHIPEVFPGRAGP